MRFPRSYTNWDLEPHSLFLAIEHPGTEYKLELALE